MRWTMLIAATAVAAGGVFALAQETKATGKPRFFELRTYAASPGKMEALHARFRDHTCKLFQKHGMEIVGFWTPTAGENADRTLVYLLAFPSREARDASFKAFGADPEWQRVKADSEKEGVKLAEKAISQFLAPTDYSPMK